jgi:hypothetical protein
VKRFVAIAFLEKLARHLMLLACLAILSKAAGWADPSQVSILLLVISATAAHWCSMIAERIRKEHLPR